MAAPCWADFELGVDRVNCLQMTGMSIFSSKGKLNAAKAKLKQMSLPQIKNEIELFLCGHLDLIDLIIDELEKLFVAMIRVRGVSFRGTSILIAYDAAALPSSRFRVQVKLLSFTNAKLSKDPCIYTLSGVLTLIEMIRSIGSDLPDEF
ncbi:hypothetical protein PMAYCL1PPCAC_31951 [Pristionchus mayeri]|uniref:Kinase n=1 Tax=Pristionchus mayeri TaxID=1317129 RepID=A0AAN5IFV9_9BILA|nr:hypothetical protein PMAYCL1PPCAC_31951 [Pristionchus mayeri]